MQNEERASVVARYWWQFTLREVFYFVALLSAYFAFVSYVGIIIAFAVCWLALVTLGVANHRSRSRDIQQLFLLARFFVFGQGLLLAVFSEIDEARNAWGVDPPRFERFVALVILTIPFTLYVIVELMRPTVAIRNDSGETLNQLSACLYLNDRLITNYQWAKVRRNSTRTIRPAILSGNLIIEYAGEVVRGRREVQLNLLRGEEFVVDLL